MKRMTLALFLALCSCGTDEVPQAVDSNTTSEAQCNSGCSAAPKTGYYAVSEVKHSYSLCPNPPWPTPPPDMFSQIFPNPLFIQHPCSLTDLNNVSNTIQNTIVGTDLCNPDVTPIDASACTVDTGVICQAGFHDPTEHDHFSATIQYVTTTSIAVSYVDEGYQPMDLQNQCQRITNVTWVWQHN